MTLNKLKLIIKSRSVKFPRPTRWPRITLPKLTGLPTVALANSKIKYVVFGSLALSGVAVAEQLGGLARPWQVVDPSDRIHLPAMQGSAAE